jgi:hypothetical protein
MSNRWAGRSVLAVPAVSIEEDEVSVTCMVDLLVDSNESLNDRPAAAALDWVQVDNSDNAPLDPRC